MRTPLDGGLIGLVCEADGPARPGLRVEVTGGRRLLVRQADQVVLLGLQRATHRGVYYARTNRYRSPLPPISAAHARQAREASVDDDAWAARWTHRFADLLHAASDGPLHAGLDTLLVLDGHDRIAAALAERTIPPVVVLAPAVDASWASGAHRHLVRAYEGRVRSAHNANANRRFAEQLDDVARGEGRTRAWPLPGGTAAWAEAGGVG